MEGGVVKEADKYVAARRFNEPVWLSLCPPAVQVQRAVVARYCITSRSRAAEAHRPMTLPGNLGT